MKVVLQIFSRDLLRLLRNPVALVVTIGVAVLPSLYAWFNVIALWDPYANTGNIPVAIVNLDRGADSHLTGRINAGKEVTDELRKNTSLGWKFIDDQQVAIDQVHAGESYAAIIIPQHFSQDLIGVINGSHTKPKLNYYVNEKKNALVPKVTDTGASTIDEQINSTFISTVSDTLANKVLTKYHDAKGSADQTRQSVVDDLGKTMDDVQEISDSLGRIQNTVGQAKQTVAESQKTLDSLNKQISSVQKALSETDANLGTVRTGSLEFSTALNQALSDGSMKLAGTASDVSQAAGTLQDGFNTTQDKVDQVTSSLGQIVDDSGKAIDRLQNGLNQSGLQPGDPSYDSIQEQLNKLKSAHDNQKKALDGFTKNSTQILQAGKQATKDLSGAITGSAQAGLGRLNQTSSALTGTLMPNLITGIDGLSTMTGTLQGTLNGLTTTVSQSKSLLDQLDSTLDRADSTLATTSTSLEGVHTDLDKVRTDVAALGSSSSWHKLEETLNLDSDSFGRAMASPVALTTHTLYPIRNYGSSLSPFYTNLALWVGGFILIAIYKLEVDKEGLRKFNATQAYLGRWLLLVFIGFFQAVIATGGDLILGIQCEHPALFMLTGVFASFIYINIIYALAATFRHIGKALAVVMVILQIPGSAGMYPIEMMPSFFRNLSPWLPFTHSIDAMRETIGGMYGSRYWLDMLTLFWYLPVALFIGLVVRRYMLSLNALFDRRLGATDLMLTEKNQSAGRPVGLSSLVKAFLGTGGEGDFENEYKLLIRRRAHRFLAIYPRLIRTGLALALLPLLFLILLFSVEAKIVMLTLCIVSIVLIDAYLIIVEYVCDRYVSLLGMTQVPGGGLRSLLRPGGAHVETADSADHS